MKRLLAQLQRLGGALMLPIAVLPVAGILLRIGAPDLFNVPVITDAGQAIFNNLGLLFAIGIAIGLARENHGAAGLAAVVAYLVTFYGAQAFISVPSAQLAGLNDQLRDLVPGAITGHDMLQLNVPVGILSGLIGGAFYNRFHRINLPSYLAFFGGRRFVPIACGFAALPLAVAFGLGWHWVREGMDGLSGAVVAAGVWGQFVYGTLNRLLIVTGLHNLLNSVMWFIVGNYHGYTGDINRFFHGDPTAGAFMTGFFPVIMFGLPAACLAMYHTALPERRTEVKGLLASIALTAFLTGVTEPVEFSFMFLAPGLYAVHALLTGVAFVITDALHMRLGFTFSAGLIDYVLNFNRDSHALLLLPLGACYFALYYGIFRWVIVKFDLKTPGREEPGTAGSVNPAMAGVLGTGPAAATGTSSASETALAYITALGGAGNLESVDACLTRLRLIVRGQDAVDVAALKRLGARGVVRLSASALQVVVGQTAERIAGDVREVLKHMPQDSAPVPSRVMAQGPKERAQQETQSPPEVASLERPLLQKLLAALGGAGNVRSVEPASSRLRIGVASTGAIDSAALRKLGMRGVAVAAKDCVHVIVGPAAEAASASLRELLAGG